MGRHFSVCWDDISAIVAVLGSRRDHFEGIASISSLTMQFARRAADRRPRPFELSCSRDGGAGILLGGERGNYFYTQSMRAAVKTQKKKK